MFSDLTFYVLAFYILIFEAILILSSSVFLSSLKEREWCVALLTLIFAVGSQVALFNLVVLELFSFLIKYGVLTK